MNTDVECKETTAEETASTNTNFTHVWSASPTTAE